MTDIDRAIADARDGLPFPIYIHSRAAYFLLSSSLHFWNWRIFIGFYLVRVYFFNIQNKLVTLIDWYLTVFAVIQRYRTSINLLQCHVHIINYRFLVFRSVIKQVTIKYMYLILRTSLYFLGETFLLHFSEKNRNIITCKFDLQM